MSELRLTVNGGEHVLDATVGTSLAHVLREELGLTGTKIACNEGHCGACTVQVDGVPRLAYGLLKGFLDGSLGSRTAHLCECYSDDAEAGSGMATISLAVAYVLAVYPALARQRACATALMPTSC